jgi:adenylate kinase family enzyme
MRKVAVLASASGCGKTTVGRELARRLEVPFVELDALHHGPAWTEATADELRARIEPTLEGDGWVIDGGYQSKLGDLVLSAADTVVWLDLPIRTWLPRLLRRTFRRIVRREELWSGNRETLRGALIGRNALIPFSLRNFRRRREEYPGRLERFDVVRLRSQKEVDDWLSSVAQQSRTFA